jgi:hypothetical protein
MTATVDESIRNGVDTAKLFATLDAVKGAPEAARFQFRARNDWLSGTHSRSTIDGFYGVGQERSHERSFSFDADHPAVLVGRDNGPTPAEFVLHALACCLTAGIANIAAARGVPPDRGALHRVRRRRPQRDPRPRSLRAKRLPGHHSPVHDPW